MSINMYYRNSIVDALKAMLVLAITRVGRYCRTTILGEVGRLLGIDAYSEVKRVFEGCEVVVRRRGWEYG
ncbi:MAG: hypothetical protein QXE01_02475 [Sulfolobales archaeon]